MLKFITERPLWVNILAGVLLAVGIFSVFVMSLNWLTHHDQSKTVPQVTGKSFDEAVEILSDAGFEIEIQDSIYTDTAKAHTVIKQFPDPDEVVKINRTVFLTINRAVPPMVEMPNLIGFSFRNAEMTLLNAGLRFGDSTYEPAFAKNAVLKQLYKGNPIQPGTRVRMGSRISFVLGSGVGNVQYAVPNLIGKTVAEARTMLEPNGIHLGVIIGAVEDTSAAYIFKQIPERYGTDRKLRHIRPGQMIDIFIQREKPEIDSTSLPMEPLPEGDPEGNEE